MRRVGAQPDERADRRTCAGTRARLQQLPQNHQRDDHTNGLIVWLARALRQQARAERDDERIGERGDRADRDERIHLGRPMRQRHPTGAVHRPAAIAHDRQREGQLQPRTGDPRGQRAVEPRADCGNHWQHRHQQQRNGTRHADDEPTGELMRLMRALVVLRLLRGADLLGPLQHTRCLRRCLYALCFVTETGDAQFAVKHVHAARERIDAWSERRQHELRGVERGQRTVDTQVGEHDVRRAFTAFLPVEVEADGTARRHLHDRRRITALHCDVRGLHAMVLHRLRGAAGREEEPHERRTEQHRHHDDDDIDHRTPPVAPCTSRARLACFFFVQQRGRAPYSTPACCLRHARRRRAAENRRHTACTGYAGAWNHAEP